MVVPNEDNMTIEGFKGLDISAHPSLIGDKSFSILKNLEVGTNGEMSRRRGLFIMTDFRNNAGWTAGKQIVYLGGYFTDNTVMYHVITVAGVPYVSTTWQRDQFTAVSGLPAGFNCIGMVQYNNMWYWISSTNGIYKTVTPSATPSASAVANTPNCAAFLLFKERLWVVQVNANQFSTLSSTIQYSAPTNLDSWTATDIVKISPGDGDVITAMLPFSEKIIVFKKTSIWAIYLQDGAIPTAATRLVIRGRGAISTRAATIINNIMYFIAADGIWRSDGSSFSKISQPLDPLFVHGPALYAYDQLDWIAYFDGRLHVRLSTAASPINPYSPNLTLQGGFYYLTMDMLTGAWSEAVYPSQSTIGYLARPTLTRNQTDGAIMQVFGGFDRLWIRSEDYWIDDVAGDHSFGQPSSQPIPVTLRSKRFAVSRPSRVKRLKYAELGLDGVVSAPQYYYVVDGENRDINDFDPASVNQYGSFKIPGCGYFRTFEFNFTDIGADRLRIDFLHFVMHTKRQLAESPR